MNLLVFTATAYLAYALQGGLAPLWTYRNTTPNLLLILLVFVGLNAPRHLALVAALVLGLLMDLRPSPLADGAVLLGPHALGFLAAGYATLQLRNFLVRKSIITLVIMTLVAGAFAALVQVLLLSLRGLPMLANEPMAWSATAQLMLRGQNLIYTTVAAIPIGLLLSFTRKIWGFTTRGRGEKIF
ncbi:MAG: rod shape-determining protein MreD [Algisphaera sp.]